MRDLTPLPGRLHLGIDIGGTKMLVVAHTSTGDRRVWRFETGPGADPALIRDRVESVLAGVGETAVIGVAVPGLVDHDGTIRDCDVLPQLIGWQPAADWPGAAVLNDGEAALATAAAGEPPEATVVAVGCGTGIVAAIQAAGRRLRQFRPYAGELGLAPCGAGGTFDDNASGSALIRTLGMSADEIVARLNQRDPACESRIRSAGEAFGMSLVTVLCLLHPEKLALYGGTLRYPGYLDAAMAALDRLSHPLLRASCRVEVMPEAELAVAQGALRFALDA